MPLGYIARYQLALVSQYWPCSGQHGSGVPHGCMGRLVGIMAGPKQAAHPESSAAWHSDSAAARRCRHSVYMCDCEVRLANKSFVRVWSVRACRQAPMQPLRRLVDLTSNMNSGSPHWSPVEHDLS